MDWRALESVQSSLRNNAKNIPLLQQKDSSGDLKERVFKGMADLKIPE
jgi:hypothetical protein